MLIYLQRFAEEGVNETETAEPLDTTQEGTVQEEPAKTAGVADQEVPKSNEPSFAWAEMRRKAKRADELEQKIQQADQKIQKADQWVEENFGDSHGLHTWDEYQKALSEQEQEKQSYVSDDINSETVEKIVQKKLESDPRLKQYEKERHDRFLIDSFKEVISKHPDIKKATDIPKEVWQDWGEGKSGRSLVSHFKEHMFDSYVEKAKQQGVNQGKSKVMATDHLDKVQGTQTTTEYDDVVLDEATIKNLEAVGIKDPKKQKEYYKKYHRS